MQNYRIQLIYLFYNQILMNSISKTSETKLEQDIVQLLSESFKLFKSQHNILQKFIFQNLNFQNTYEGNQLMKNQLNLILKDQKQIMEKLKVNRNNLINFRLTFYRLFNRFLQIVHKYNKNSNRRHFQVINQYYTSIQKIIDSTISNQIFLYYESLVQISEIGEQFATKIMSQYLLEELDLQKPVPIMIEDKPQFDKQSQKSSDRKSTTSNGSTIESNKLILLKNISSEKQEKQGFLDYLNTLNCLDIDYNQFRKMIANIQNPKNILYNQLYSKNVNNSELILKYYKDYMNYKLKRRENFHQIQNKYRQELTPILQRKQSKKQAIENLNISLINPQITTPKSLQKLKQSQKSERKSVRSQRTQKTQKSKQKSYDPNIREQNNIFSTRRTSQNINVLNRLLKKLDEDMKINQLAKKNLLMKFDNKITFELKKVSIQIDKPLKQKQVQLIIPVKKTSTVTLKTVKKTWDKRYIMVQGQKCNQFLAAKKPKKYSCQFNMESQLF